ncbi:TPA: hypothetical protein G8N85_005174 [Salmonella enterica]|uniref:Type 1 fimbrial protein n=1 Tax=Salmonella enterica TaxID=28901 RepID=A0A743Z4K5_SALER|nr:hypothetical protein [Salmonella enterica]
MKGMFKYAAMAVAFGVMGSSAAMAATGDQIGTGSVTVHGNVTNATCAVDWTTKNSSVNLILDTLKNSDSSAILANVPQKFSLSNCSGQSVLLSLNAATKGSDPLRALPTGTDNDSAPFYIQSAFSDAKDLSWNAGIDAKYTPNAILTMDGTPGVVVTPSSDSSTYEMTNIIKSGIGRATAQAKMYDVTYTYNFTYK